MTKKFNINEYIYIQITDEGWIHLANTVGILYINACIKNPHYEKMIDGEVWYKLQCHEVFNVLPIQTGSRPLFKTNIMIEFKDEPEQKPERELKLSICIDCGTKSTCFSAIITGRYNCKYFSKKIE